MGKRTFWNYIQAAFKNPWHLLVLGAGTVAGLISGHADVALPIVAAGEMIYLTSLAGHPRFQHYVDHYQNVVTSSQSNEVARKRFDDMYQGLDDRARRAFDELRGRCLSVSELAETGGKIDPLAAEQLQGINKLLWVYLKLLHTKARLERFFASTDEREIEQLLADSRRRLAGLPNDATTNPITEKKKKTLEDTLATAEARKGNLKRAQENHEFVELELQRISAKLSGVVELAANRSDPAALTTEVDDAARSVVSTEQMMSELQMFTGITQEEEGEAPEILAVRRAAAAQRQRV
jgi:hypothetical protein